MRLSEWMATQKLVELNLFMDYVHVDENVITVHELPNQEITKKFHSNGNKEQELEQEEGEEQVEQVEVR